MLCVLDEHTGECLVIGVGKSLRSQDVILTLSRLMRGVAPIKSNTLRLIGHG